VTGVRFLEDSTTTVVTTCEDGVIRWWDSRSGKVANYTHVPNEGGRSKLQLTCLDVSSSHVAVGTDTGKVVVYDVSKADQPLKSLVRLAVLVSATLSTFPCRLFLMLVWCLLCSLLSGSHFLVLPSLTSVRAITLDGCAV
jgi:WD40 repeat protein